MISQEQNNSQPNTLQGLATAFGQEGKTGLLAALEAIKTLFDEGEPIWIKSNSQTFWYGRVEYDKDFILYHAKRVKKNGRTTRTLNREYSKHLSELIDRTHRSPENISDSGLLFMAGKPTGQPYKEFIKDSEIIWMEGDSLNKENQAASIQKISDIFGTPPNVVCSSGGKSYHYFYRLTERRDHNDISRIIKLIAAFTNGDFAVASYSRFMRLAGGFRHNRDNRNKEQELIYSQSETRLDYDRAYDALVDILVSQGIFRECDTNNYETVDAALATIEKRIVGKFETHEEYCNACKEYWVNGKRELTTKEYRKLEWKSRGVARLSKFSMYESLEDMVRDALLNSNLSYDPGNNTYKEVYLKMWTSIKAHLGSEFAISLLYECGDKFTEFARDGFESKIHGLNTKTAGTLNSKVFRWAKKHGWKPKSNKQDWTFIESLLLGRKITAVGLLSLTSDTLLASHYSGNTGLPTEDFTDTKEYIEDLRIGQPTNRVIKFEEGKRTEVCARLIHAALRSNPGRTPCILDRSPTGTGKSSDSLLRLHKALRRYGQFTNENYVRLNYISTDPNNVINNVEGAREFCMKEPARSNLPLVNDSGRLYRRNEGDIKEEDTKVEDPTCFYADFFHTLSEQNLRQHSTKKNNICNTCYLSETCKSTKGWYLHDKMSAKDEFQTQPYETYQGEKPRHVAVKHPSQVVTMGRDTNTEIKVNEINIVDEAGVTLNASTLSFTMRDWKYLLACLRNEHIFLGIQDHEEILARLDEVTLLLEHGFSETDYGHDSREIKKKLGSFPLDTEGARQLTEAINNIAASLYNRAIENAGFGEDSVPIQRDYIPVFFLDKLFAIWKNEIGGDISQGRKFDPISRKNDRNADRLIIKTENYEFRDALMRGKGLILLDATTSVTKISQRLSIDPSDIIVIKQEETKRDDNIEIYAIDIPGAQSNAIRQKTLDRFKHILCGISDVTGDALEDIGVITHKAYRDELGGAIYHNSGGARGSNLYSGKKTLVIMGRPNPHLGDITSDYRTFTGDDASDATQGSDLSDYYQEELQDTIVQEMGRNRANLHPDETFRVFFVWSGVVEDVDFLRGGNYGHDIHIIDSRILLSDFLIEKHPRVRVLHAFGELNRLGRKFTMKNVSEFLDISQSTIKETVKGDNSELNWKQLTYLASEYIKKRDNKKLEQLIEWATDKDPLTSHDTLVEYIQPPVTDDQKQGIPEEGEKAEHETQNKVIVFPTKHGDSFVNKRSGEEKGVRGIIRTQRCNSTERHTQKEKSKDEGKCYGKSKERDK